MCLCVCVRHNTYTLADPTCVATDSKQMRNSPLSSYKGTLIPIMVLSTKCDEFLLLFTTKK